MKLSFSMLAASSVGMAGAFAPRTIMTRQTTSLNIAAGDALPSATLFKDFPDPQKIDIADYVKDKNVIIVGLPGAFTPTCSSTQVPGYLESEEELKAAGVEEVVVYCVNDPAVMQAWSEDQGVGGSFITMMGDPAAEFTAALDMKMVHPGPPSVGIVGRCKRFAMHVVEGEVKFVAVSEAEDDPAGDDDPSATLADALLKVVAPVEEEEAAVAVEE